MTGASVASDPPAIAGVRRSYVSARGVRFHVTESGTGTPVVVLHGWPEHHYCYRDLLADPPEGLRIIAPDLPGYGWSGAAPHRWDKQDVADDLLALLDALGLKRVLLVGHDWGAFIGYLLVLGAPQRFGGLLALNIAHPWNTPRTLLPHMWRLGHMPVMAVAGRPLMQRTRVLEKVIFRLGVGEPGAITSHDIRLYADRFRDPVCAQVTTDTYRTFLLCELPAAARNPERRRATVPIRVLHGSADFAIHPALVSADTVIADDYSVELLAGCGHFGPEERPDQVRSRLVTLAAQNPV
jgi:pimeloyl-ACP methyl ester carboxylesterase